jgi:hypothetical protein
MCKQKVPFINNGKRPNELLNAKNAFWLPADTPFGNFTLKLFKIISRVDEINRRIDDTYRYWNAVQKTIQKQEIDFNNSFERHWFSVEQAVYLIRKVADELISLYYVLSIYEKTKKWPQQVSVDCVGDLLNADEFLKSSPFRDHLIILKKLNEISNAYKHSFVNSDINLVGREEPMVLVLSIKYNRLTSGIKFYDMPFSGFIHSFNRFYEEMIDWLKKYSKRNISDMHNNQVS